MVASYVDVDEIRNHSSPNAIDEVADRAADDERQSQPLVRLWRDEAPRTQQNNDQSRHQDEHGDPARRTGRKQPEANTRVEPKTKIEKGKEFRRLTSGQPRRRKPLRCLVKRNDRQQDR